MSRSFWLDTCWKQGQVQRAARSVCRPDANPGHVSPSVVEETQKEAKADSATASRSLIRLSLKCVHARKGKEAGEKELKWQLGTGILPSTAWWRGLGCACSRCLFLPTHHSSLARTTSLAFPRPRPHSYLLSLLLLFHVLPNSLSDVCGATSSDSVPGNQRQPLLL